MKYRMNLQLFEEGAGTAGGQNGSSGGDNGANGGTGANGSQGNAGATFSFEQAEEIANARAHRAEQAALRSYFQQQGMTQEEVSQALQQFRQQREAQQPNLGVLQQERDDALRRIEQMENEKHLSGKGVRSEDLDYVMFKVSKLVDDKTDFKKAADKFLKENPRFVGGGYRVSTGVSSTGAQGAEKGNESINAAIRRAAGR